MPQPLVGILALQGDFTLHQKSVKRLGVNTLLIRHPEDLEKCSGLILPGGESTTFVKLLKINNLFDAIRMFAEKHGVMGTCAGLITLASRVTNDSFETLELMDVRVERNAYGRQVDSFTDTIQIPIFKDKPGFEGIFIRAPKILDIGSKTEALGFYGDEIVMARNKHVLVTTFHPELTNDKRVHQYFLDELVMEST